MPGKFEGCASETVGDFLYGLTLEGWCDEECGDAVEGWGWHGMLTWTDGGPAEVNMPGCVGAIVHEDTNGFITYDLYASQATMRADWDRIVTAMDDPGQSL